jgi:hypothetical protein
MNNDDIMNDRMNDYMEIDDEPNKMISLNKFTRTIRFLKSNTCNLFMISLSLLVSVISIILVSSIRDDVNYARGQIDTIENVSDKLSQRMIEMMLSVHVITSQLSHQAETITKTGKDLKRIGICNETEISLSDIHFTTPCKNIKINIPSNLIGSLTIRASYDRIFSDNEFIDDYITFFGNYNSFSNIKSKYLIINGIFNYIMNVNVFELVAQYTSSVFIYNSSFNEVVSQYQSSIFADQDTYSKSWYGYSNSIVILARNITLHGSKIYCDNHGLVISDNGTNLCNRSF